MLVACSAGLQENRYPDLDSFGLCRMYRVCVCVCVRFLVFASGRVSIEIPNIWCWIVGDQLLPVGTCFLVTWFMCYEVSRKYLVAHTV